MLILSRRIGETLILTTEDGLQIRFTVLGLKGNQVRVGVEAPRSVNVLREELMECHPPTGTEPSL